ncbi:MAG: ABC transporter ATP-binding protein, partial [Burkholderiaceae bacterium]|nr:ABC transporter ATP-binding protein [Burkholderiaceae bacterium]
GLVGESGAGKSMIGRVISGIMPENLEVSSGQVWFGASDLLRLDRRSRREMLGRRIAFVPQEPLSALNPVLSVGQQMFEHLARLGVPRRLRHEYAVARFAEVGLPDPATMLARYSHELSGGQCQRVLIAMAFSGDPQLIVADEPTTALDVVTQAQIVRVLQAVQRRHRTAVLLITHDLRLAAHVCEEIAVLHAGDLVESGPAVQVLAAPAHPYTRSLRLASPSLDGEVRRLPDLAEFMPGLAEMKMLSGCRFVRRCPARRPECERRAPVLAERLPGHRVACTVGVDATPSADLEPHAAPMAPSGGATPLISFEGVAVSYQGRSRHRRAFVQALEPLSLAIEAGDMIGIVGESGSGKSTIARVMVGLLEPTAGMVRVKGVDRAAVSGNAACRLGKVVQMVFQDPDSALNPRRSVRRLVTQALETDRSMAAGEIDARAAALLRQVGIAIDALERSPSQLSGGQKQRVNIARALCVVPELLVADEIVSGLDVSVQALVLNLLLRINRELGITVVFISHDLSVVRYLCRRVLVMYRGKLLEEGETASVFARPQHPYTRLLLDSVPPDDARAIWPGARSPEDAVSW